MRIAKASVTFFAWMILAATSIVIPTAGAQTTGLRVLTSNAVKAVVDSVRPQMEQAVGCPLIIQYETSAGIKRAIDAGTPFDVTILNAELMDVLVKEGKVTGGSRTDIARTGIGVGVRAGTPLPDIATAESIKRTLLGAHKVAYPKEGSSTPVVVGMFNRLGILEQIQSNTLTEISTNVAIADVAEGRAEMLVSLISEVLPAKGIQFVGPVPTEFQGNLVFSAGIGNKAENMPYAQALIKYLTSPAIVPALKDKGMEQAKK